MKSDDLSKRTLRITAYTVDSTTRIRTILGHVFLKFDPYLSNNSLDRTFSTTMLSECLKQDLSIRSDYLGELILTSTFFKDQNYIQIHIQSINHLQIDSTKDKHLPMKGIDKTIHELCSSLCFLLNLAHFTGQISNNLEKSPWINSSTFVIPTSSSYQVDQDMKLTVPSSTISIQSDHLNCHVRLHLHDNKQIHSHARWQQSLRLNSSQNLTVPLFNL